MAFASPFTATVWSSESNESLKKENGYHGDDWSVSVLSFFSSKVFLPSRTAVVIIIIIWRADVAFMTGFIFSDIEGLLILTAKDLRFIRTYIDSKFVHTSHQHGVPTCSKKLSLMELLSEGRSVDSWRVLEWEAGWFVGYCDFKNADTVAICMNGYNMQPLSLNENFR